MIVNENISNNLHYLREIKCRCWRRFEAPLCDGGTLRYEVARLFEDIRLVVSQYLRTVDHGGTPIQVNSALRCVPYNTVVYKDQGLPHPKKPSRHCYGEALDLVCPDGMPREVFWGIAHDLNPQGGVGFYRLWEKGLGGVHVDICESPPSRRWYQRSDGGVEAGLPVELA